MSRIVEFTRIRPSRGPDLQGCSRTTPAAGEVRIRVKAIGLNRAESMWRHGEYIEPVKLPARLGYEAAGTVDALGSGVTQFAVGEPVNVIPSFSMNDYSTYGDLISCRQARSSDSRSLLSFVEAASIWMMFVTAYSALIEDAGIGDQGRLRRHPGRIQQRRARGDPDRQLCRCNAHRAYAHVC